MNLESDVTCVQVWIGTISFLIFRLDDRLTCVDHPAIMEEGDSEYDLTYKGFDRLSGTMAEHEHPPEMRTNDREHQYVVHPVRSTNSKLVQERKDIFSSWVFLTRFGCKVMVDQVLPPKILGR